MFYSYDLLCHRAGGKFSLVWLAATHKRLPANDYLRINIVKTCQDIMEIIKNQEPRMTSKNARSRFSLYLSSMLLYGVCIVYRQQVIVTIDNMMNLFHMTITCNGTKKQLETSGDGGENDGNGAKKGRKRKKQHQLEPVDEKFLAELTVPLKDPPQGIVLSPRFSPNSRPPTVAMPPDVMQTLKVPQMILDDKGPDAPMEQICDQLTKIFAAEELLATDSQKTEKPLTEDKAIEDKPIEDKTDAAVPFSETVVVPVAVAESETSIVPTELAENMDAIHQADKDLSAVPALLDNAHRNSDLKPPSPSKSPETYKNEETKIHSIDAAASTSHQMAENVPEVVGPVTEPAVTAGASVKIDNAETKTDTPAARPSRRRASPDHQQEVPHKRKRRTNVLLEDEQVEISKHSLRIQIGKDDTEIRALDIEKEIKSYVSPKNVKFLFENPCCLDLPDVCQILITKTYQVIVGQLQAQQRQSNLEESVEIQRGQRTPTPPQSPLQSLRGEGSSLMRNEVSDITPKLQPIIETNFEELDVPTKPDSVINVEPLIEVPEIDVPSTSIDKEKRDSNLEKMTLETVQQKEVENGDTEMMQPPIVESSVTDAVNTEIAESAVCGSISDMLELPEEPEKVSKPLRETMNVWRRLKILEKSVNRTVTIYDLCPLQSTTKFRASVVFKCLLELDFQKKVALQQDKSVPFGPIYISLR